MSSPMAPEGHGGTLSVRPIGQLWIVGHGRETKSETGGDESMITLGYDADKRAFVGTFIASMMSMLWSYDGPAEPDGDRLDLLARGPSMKGDGTLVDYRDTVTVESPDRWTLRSATRDDAGEWQEFMVATYVRA